MSKNPLGVFAALVTCTVLSAAERAQDANQMTLVAADAAIKWQSAPPSLPQGTQMVVLNGDPAKAGPFVLRIKFQAHTVVAPHTHNTAENLTVLAGTLYHGMGETLDKAQGQKLTHGAFVYLPGGSPHSVWTTKSAAIVQVTGTGPLGLNYVNPADDPSKTR